MDERSIARRTDMVLLPTAIVLWLIAVLGIHLGFGVALAVGGGFVLLVLTVVIILLARGQGARPDAGGGPSPAQALVLHLGLVGLGGVLLVPGLLAHHITLEALMDAESGGAVVELVVTTRSDARPSRSAEAWGGDQVQSRARVLPGPALLGRERVHLPGSPEVLVTGSAGSGLAQVRSGQEVRVRARVSTSGALRVMRVTEVEVVDPGPAWRRTLQDTARERTSELPADPVALARGMTTGDTIGLGEETEEAMRRAGISHLVAVSGRPIRLVVLAPNVTRSTRLPW